MYYPNYQNFNPNQNPYAMPYQQMPTLTLAMHQETTKLIDKMKDVVGSVLPASLPLASNREWQTQRTAVPSIAVNPINFDFSRREYNLFSSKETHHHHANPTNYPNAYDQREKERKKEAQNNFLIGILGFGVMAATAYFLGKNDAQNEESQEEEVSFEALKRSWTYNRPAYYAQAANLIGMIEDSINKVEGILARKQTERVHRTALLLLTFSAGALLGVGAIVGSGLLINSGYAVGAVTTIFALYKLGYNCFNNRNAKDAKIVENNLNALHYPMQNLVLAR